MTETRESLRGLLRNDPALQGLNTERTRQLAVVIDHLYGQDQRRLPRANRFADNHLIQFVFVIGGREYKNPLDERVQEPSRWRSDGSQQRLTHGEHLRGFAAPALRDTGSSAPRCGASSPAALTWKRSTA